MGRFCVLYRTEAKKLKTIDDLLQSDDERVELINGEVVKRPMACSEHALIQSSIADEVLPFKRRHGPGGWWIMPEISVKYSEHQCPSHDLAGWRKERIPQRPQGIMDVIPDWVCEITSPGHERKDVFNNFMLLQLNNVPYYWVISPEDKTLIAYKLVDEKYHVTFSVEYRVDHDLDKANIPPFEEIESALNKRLAKTTFQQRLFVILSLLPLTESSHEIQKPKPFLLSH